MCCEGAGATFPTFAQKAENEYQGHSYGGPAHARLSIPALLTDLLVWLRDATGLLDWMLRKGWIVPDANATVFFVPKEFESPGTALTPAGQGIALTSVQVNNLGNEVLRVAWVWIDVCLERDGGCYQSIRAFPRSYPTIVSPDFNRLQPGDRFTLRIDPIDVPRGRFANVQVHIRSASGRFGRIELVVAP